MVGQLGDLDIDVEDIAEVVLKFQSGVFGSVNLNYQQRPPVHSIEIVGTKGTVCWENQDGITRIYQTSTQEWDVISPPEGFDRNDIFLAEISHFLEVVTGVAQPVCNLVDGIRALQIAVAARSSTLTNTQVLYVGRGVISG